MIDINEIGATAFVIASIRALEDEKPEPLFSDPHAEWFSNERAREAARQLDIAFPPATTMVRFRTRYFNRFVERGIADGARQVVLLGGGFDMRAHRYGGPDVAFFEVDQKTVLEFKRVVLERGGLVQPPSLLTNYLKADVPGDLAEFGFDPHARTLIIWEGNTMYLPPESIMPFLNRLADAMSSFRMAFDYFALDLQNRESAGPRGSQAARRRGTGDGRLVPHRVLRPDSLREAGAVRGRRIGVFFRARRGVRIG